MPLHSHDNSKRFINYGVDESLLLTVNNRTCNYKLKSGVWHKGDSLDSGHYFTATENFVFNDSVVTNSHDLFNNHI